MPEEWANQTHSKARIIWDLRPTDDVLDDRYYRGCCHLHRQLGVAGLRLARFINDAYASDLASGSLGGSPKTFGLLFCVMRPHLANALAGAARASKASPTVWPQSNSRPCDA